MTDMVELPDEIDLRAHSSQRTWDPQVPGGVFEHVRSRTIREVTGIVLHQTACVMGERPERYLNTGAHFVCTRGGQRLRLHDVTDRIVSANGFNARCVSIECDGIYPGDDSNQARAIATTWDDPTTKIREQPMVPTLALIAVARGTIRAIVREVRAAGGEVKYLFAHRQSSETRENDPGACLWREVAIPMIAELGLNVPTPSFDPRTFAIDSGRPIPTCWDPACSNRY